MSTLSELDPDSPEYEAAAQAAQEAEDAARETSDEPESKDEEPKDEPKQEAEPTQAEAKTDPEPGAKEPEPAKPAKPIGVLAKDGKTVLPYGALQGARQQAAEERIARQAAETRAKDLEQQIADLKAGKTPAPSEELTPEAEAEMLADFPGLRPVIAELKATKAEVVRLRATTAPAKDDAPAEPVDDVQDAIDSVPLLSEWQSDRTHADKWQRALVIDKALEGSPKWAGKPLADRFAHVARTVADEFDIQVDTPQKEPTATAKAAQVIKGAPRAAPNTLSDFKGGAAELTTHAIERMPAAKQVDVLAGKSDAEIDAWLRKFG